MWDTEWVAGKYFKTAGAKNAMTEAEYFMC